MKSYVLINVNAGSELELLEGLKKMKSVKNANIVLGEFDIIVELEHNTMTDLNDYISNEIGYLDNVVSTQTLIAVKAY